MYEKDTRLVSGHRDGHEPDCLRRQQAGQQQRPAGNANGDAAAAETPVTIVFGNYGSSSMPPYFADQDAIAYAEEKSEGSIKFEYSADGVLGSEFDMIQQVMDGTIQGAILSSSTFSTYTNLMECFQLPFLITSYDREQKSVAKHAKPPAG